MTDFDSPWKEALDVYFEQFVAFFFPEVHGGIDWSRGYDSLDQELRQVLREADLGRRVVDKLVRVWRVGGEEIWVVVHVEIQAQYEASFAHRMFVCHYRLFDNYARQPVNLAVLADDRPAWRPDSFAHALWGCELSFRYPTIKLLDYRDRLEALQADPNPFAVVVAAHLKTLETRHDSEARMSWKTLLVRSLYERGYDRQDVVQLFRFIDWLMDLPPELEQQFQTEIAEFEQETAMPYLSTMERWGIERGLAEGRERGLAEGTREQALRDIESGLKAKFADDGLALMPAIRQIDELQRLEAILDRLWTATNLEELPLNGE
ncbi:MAG TPA: hypothetical protein VML55_20060 [Planctomycetaceae bacterium]|nr:hypothetical protein [Planctomycetaceae bacterium]